MVSILQSKEVLKVIAVGFQFIKHNLLWTSDCNQASSACDVYSQVVQTFPTRNYVCVCGCVQDEKTKQGGALFVKDEDAWSD
jgi:hypothetical protein